MKIVFEDEKKFTILCRGREVIWGEIGNPITYNDVISCSLSLQGDIILLNIIGFDTIDKFYNEIRKNLPIGQVSVTHANRFFVHNTEEMKETLEYIINGDIYGSDLFE